MKTVIWCFSDQVLAILENLLKEAGVEYEVVNSVIYMTDPTEGFLNVATDLGAIIYVED